MGRENQRDTSKLTTYSNAIESLADKLLIKNEFRVNSFWEFIRDVWSLGYEKQSYFNAWHVGYICDQLTKALEEGKWFMAVLPRMHLKSTVLGHGFTVWQLLRQKNDASLLYLSYNAAMSQYHIREMKNAIRRNPILSPAMLDRSNDADYSFRYQVGKRQLNVMHGGLFAFKRGMHTTGLVADDVLKDPQNPLTPNQVYQIEEHFKTESIYIPNKGSPIVVLGTPMLPDDLLSKLKDDDRFNYVVLPALDPMPGRRVLFPELYNETDLMQIKKSSPNAFATEFMLAPRLSTDAYFSDEEITSCENAELRNFIVDAEDLAAHLNDFDYTVAGFDVGKKRHPSHITVFGKKNGKFYQLHQQFMDEWLYTDQVDLLNKIATKFQISRGYYDNTKAELEDRNLARVWRPISFTIKSKHQMAAAFDFYVHSGNLNLIKNDRQKSQIICVNKELQAAETPTGHGDSFFSCAMACQAMKELDINTVTTIGDMNSFISESEPVKQAFYTKAMDPQKSDDAIKCPTCQQSIGYNAEAGICIVCKSAKIESDLNKILNRGMQ